ncbi:MAG: hypothetical protein ABSE69_02885 [Roseiarcus sp.]|jgi:hypothetical protein
MSGYDALTAGMAGVRQAQKSAAAWPHPGGALEDRPPLPHLSLPMNGVITFL